MSENKLTSLMRINFLLKLNDFPIFFLFGNGKRGTEPNADVWRDVNKKVALTPALAKASCVTKVIWD